MDNSEYIAMGMMSGTSLDGLDIAICSFIQSDIGWKYKILYSVTHKYDNKWKEALNDAMHLNGEKLIRLDREYGNYLGRMAKKAIGESGLQPDIISSHGHTIFHDPEAGYTLQIGHGSYIASITNIDVVSDFRSGDIARGGQGAPLVPVGDKLLFQEYRSCLNLGGFSNISFDQNKERIAFDICPVNTILNDIAGSLGYEYDKNGVFGRKGSLSESLLKDLNALSYYKLKPPKSLSREWLNREVFPLLENSNIAPEDQLNTIYTHIAFQISSILEKYQIDTVLITGGGAHNGYLLQLLKDNTQAKLVVPEKTLIDYKEATVFAFLGLLRSLYRINSYASVTGADCDSICGILHYGQKKSEPNDSLLNPNYKKI